MYPLGAPSTVRELLGTPSKRSSQNPPSTHSGVQEGKSKDRARWGWHWYWLFSYNCRGSSGGERRKGGAGMAVEVARRTMEAYVEDLLGGPYKRHFSDDVVVALVGTDQGAEGPDGAEAWIDHLHTVAFKARPELKSMIVDDGQAAAEFDFVGEHVGEFGGVAATGREVRVPYGVVYDLRGGEISAVRIYLSLELLMRQLGDAP